MKNDQHEKEIIPKDLPQNEVFTKKEHYQFPQPQDTDVPLRPEESKQKSPTADNSKEEEKTSKTEGLNEANSAGDAGAFEGFEDHSKK